VKLNSSFKRIQKRTARRLKRRIEQRSVDSVLPQHGRGEDRLQRRIRLHFLHLLAVGEEVVAVREKNFGHGGFSRYE
jgi:hypothetical protein